MQSLEAAFSLIVFLSLGTAFLLESEPPRAIDDSLYRIQLADDAWRILYLRGHLDDLSDSSREAVESDLRAMGEDSSLCFFIRGVEFTNCRDDSPHVLAASVSRTVIRNGKPERFTFSIGK
jgi:hypothetical protein